MELRRVADLAALRGEQCKGNMEVLSLALALIAVRNAYRRQETPVPEPDEFQRFDVQGLRSLHYGQDESASRPSDRQESNLSQVAF
jgi:hypothetical protein